MEFVVAIIGVLIISLMLKEKLSLTAMLSLNLSPLYFYIVFEVDGKDRVLMAIALVIIHLMVITERKNRI